VYLNPAHIPDSPGEPASTISDEDVDKDVTVMECGPEVDGYFFSDTVPQPQETAASTVADLVAQLATGNAPLVVNGLSGGDSGAFGMNGLNNDAGSGFGGMRMNIVNLEGQCPSVNLNINKSCCLDAMAAIQQQMQTLAPEQMQILLQQLNPAGGSAGYGGDSWQSGGPGQFTDFGFNGESGNGDRAWADTGSGIGGRGRGGRFRGRGRGGGDGNGFRHSKRKPCTFFQSGRRANYQILHISRKTDTSQYRCKYGDQCDFAHELIS
jgi:protein phosphatase 1 regulatory subunit 10